VELSGGPVGLRGIPAPGVSCNLWVPQRLSGGRGPDTLLGPGIGKLTSHTLGGRRHEAGINSHLHVV
jgi:hypothetical protein